MPKKEKPSPADRTQQHPGKRPSTRQLRAIGHKLHPVVTVAGNGLSDSVRNELERALADHELIKIKVSVGDRNARDLMIGEVTRSTGAEMVQRIGNTALLLRRSAQPDPRKSNLIKALS